MGLFDGFKSSVEKHFKNAEANLRNPFSVENPFNKIDRMVGAPLKSAFNINLGINNEKYTFKGYDKDELSQFMQGSNSVASQKSSKEIKALNQKSKKVSVEEYLGEDGGSQQLSELASTGEKMEQFNPFDTMSKDKMNKMVSSYKKRQSEVFGRRSTPGIAAQTRLG